MKFGENYKYQKFTGLLSDKKVTGFICLEDNNIYNVIEI